MHFKATLLLKVSLSLSQQKRTLENVPLLTTGALHIANLSKFVEQTWRYFDFHLWHCTPAHYLIYNPLFYVALSFYRIPTRLSRPLKWFHRPEVPKTVSARLNTVPGVLESSAIPIHKR